MTASEEFNTTARKKAFEQATRELVQRARNLSAHFNFTPQYDIGDAVQKIRNTFQNREIRKQVLNPKWESINFEDARYTEGFCAITSYVFANIFKPENGLTPWQIKQFKNIQTFGTHVWLEFAPTGEVLDLTFDQFIDFEGTRMNVPYHKGKPAVAEFKNPGLDKFVDAIGPEFAAAFRRNTQSK